MNPAASVPTTNVPAPIPPLVFLCGCVPAFSLPVSGVLYLKYFTVGVYYPVDLPLICQFVHVR